MMTGSRLILVCGFLVIVVILAIAYKNGDTSVSKQSRVARFAEAGDRRKRKVIRNKRRNKKGKKNMKTKSRKNRKKRRNLKGFSTSDRRKRNKRRIHRKNRKPAKGVKEGYRKKRRNCKGSRDSDRDVDVTCVENVITVMRRWKDVVSNFQKQKTRIEKQATIAGKKSDKKAVFGPIALQLVELGGGNKSALTCGCSADTAGARQLTNLTRILMECEEAVHASCAHSFPLPNMTYVETCATATGTFVTLATECLARSKKDEDGGCSCWSSSNMTEASEAAKDCKIKEVSSIAMGLKACKEEFSKCRKYEDEVISIMAACSHPVHQLKEQAAVLYTNKVSIEAASTKVAGVEKNSSSESCGQFLQLVQTCKLVQYHEGKGCTIYFQWHSLVSITPSVPT